MSGSSALSAARRRRASTNDVNENFIPNENLKKDTYPISELEILKLHHAEIINIKNNMDIINTTKNNDSLEDTKKEILEIKKTMMKLQSFMIDFDNDIKKIKTKINISDNLNDTD